MNDDERREEMERITAEIARSVTNRNMNQRICNVIDRIDGKIIEVMKNRSKVNVYKKDLEDIVPFYDIYTMDEVYEYYKSQGFKVYEDETAMTIRW